MSIFKRAILYIFRNKTRTILLVIILAFLMLISLNGIAIKSSVDRESEEVIASIAVCAGAVVIVSLIAGKLRKE